MSDQSLNPNYVHDNLFRQPATATLGQPLNLEGTPCDFVIAPFSFDIDMAIVAENCKIVAFLRDEQTHEVWQAEEIDLSDL
jgi:hypothetical protein